MTRRQFMIMVFSSFVGLFYNPTIFFRSLLQLTTRANEKAVTKSNEDTSFLFEFPCEFDGEDDNSIFLPLIMNG